MDSLTDTINEVMEGARPTNKVVVIIDGYVTDADSGEVYGLVEDCNLVGDYGDGEYIYRPENNAAFRVDSHAAADWVLAKRMECEAELAKIEMQRAAVNEHFDRMGQPHRDRLKHLSYRFDGELESFARANLPEGKESLVLPHGTVAFRTIPASVSLRDEDRAIQWADKAAPEIVRKHVTKTDVVKAWKEHMPGYELPLFLETVPARESVTIKTGL